MTYKEILDIFQQDYNRDSWKELIYQLFNEKEFVKSPSPLPLSTQTRYRIASEILDLGEITLNDNLKLKIYEVQLLPGKLMGGRVTLRNLVSSEIIPGITDGALVIFYSPDQPDWRFSFISRWYDGNENLSGRLKKIETNPKRFTYVLGRNQTCKTAAAKFTELADKKNNPEITDLLQVFSVESVSNDFFREYVKHFNLFSDHLTVEQVNIFGEGETIEEKEKLIRNFVKKLLGRIVFLYFLQKKGWLGAQKKAKVTEGEYNFMQNLYKNCPDKTKFYSEWLTKLFFNALNDQRKNNVFSLTDTQVPYLNGGLFENDFTTSNNIDFPQEYFDSLFVFLDRFNFTVDENNPDDYDIGIDPEMLGRVFESLLGDDKKKLGTFYTPKNVVHYMCQESIFQYLCAHLVPLKIHTKDSLYQFIFKREADSKIKEQASQIENLLDNVKICDPAIGSGAFPMGMVHEIIEAKYLLFYLKRGTHFNLYEAKLHIIQNSIHGVDKDMGAVDIARLRFWLSLIVDAEEPQPLPNLDYKIMQGDSLYEEFEGIPLNRMHSTGRKITFVEKDDLFPGAIKIKEQKITLFENEDQINKLISEYYEAIEAKKKKILHKKIDALLNIHIKLNIQAHQQKLQWDIDKTQDLLDKKLVQFPSESAKEKFLEKSSEVKKIANFSKEKNLIIQKQEKLDRLQDKAERPYFLWHLFFGNVLNSPDIGGQGGFDIVIANPPYGVDAGEYLRDTYNLGSKDIFGVFISFALQKLLRPNGILTYVVTDTWLTITSHKKLREQILQSNLHKIIRLHQDAFDATVNCCIMVVGKKSPEFDHQLIAADLTNISTRKQTGFFNEIIQNLESKTSISTFDFSIYQYDQNIIHSNTNIPFFVASPKLFNILKDIEPLTISKIIFNNNEESSIPARQIENNANLLSVFKLSDISGVKHGLTSGDNYSYIFKSEKARGTYQIVDFDKVLSNKELLKLSDEEKKYGFNPQIFDGKYIIPYDKGGASNTDDGWLPKYYVPTEYYIDWRQSSVKKMMKLIGHRHDNPDYYFKEGITYSSRGAYSPTFRVNAKSCFDKESSCIFSVLDNYYLLGLLNSKLILYFFRSFIQHTVSSDVDAIKQIPIVFTHPEKISHIVLKIIDHQKIDRFYDFASNEQKEIDKLVYDLYGLNDDDINEVETWYARRYPKLAEYADIKPPKAEIETEDEFTIKVKELIASGENKYTEFKSALRYDLKLGKPMPHIEHSAMKTIAAFLNSEGGTLIIGADDTGQILGLDKDLDSFGKGNKLDAFRLHFDTLVSKVFGNHIMRLLDVSFPVVDDKMLCMVQVKEKAPEEVFLKDDGKEKFYIRRTASTVELSTSEVVKYVKGHWG
jgi:hypothetical protein